MTPLNKQIRLGAMAVLIVFLVGVAIAVARPGDLGDDDTAAPTRSTTTTQMTVAETTTSTTLGVTTTTAAGASTTTTPASGLGATGSGSAGRRNLANTGGEALLLPAMGLLGVALATRRLGHR